MPATIGLFVHRLEAGNLSGKGPGIHALKG
jgi:hypothetical protein